MTAQQHDDGRVDERLQNLGRVVDSGKKLDKALRNAFCSIIGNKYAAVLADGASAKWLIANCRAVLVRHRGITGEHRANILLALDTCDAANARRGELVHGITTASAAADGEPGRSHCSPGCAPDSETQIWPAERILEVADEISAADTRLLCAMRNAVSPELMAIGEALAWEERRDSGTRCE